MRKALNENPAVQAGLVVILIIAFVFIFFTRIMGGKDAPPSEVGAPAVAGSTVPGASAVTTPEPGTVPSGGATPAADPPAAGSPEFVAGPGLPQEVVKAYADGKAVVLLITRAKGIDDRRIADEVDRLRSGGDVAVFTTSAQGIARYSRITNGVNVDRTPALVVLRPRRASEGGLPLATVSYGFRGSQSVQQAVRDALYQGRSDIPYYPE